MTTAPYAPSVRSAAANSSNLAVNYLTCLFNTDSAMSSGDRGTLMTGSGVYTSPSMEPARWPSSARPITHA